MKLLMENWRKHLKEGKDEELPDNPRDWPSSVSRERAEWEKSMDLNAAKDLITYIEGGEPERKPDRMQTKDPSDIIGMLRAAIEIIEKRASTEGEEEDLGSEEWVITHRPSGKRIGVSPGKASSHQEAVDLVIKGYAELTGKFYQNRHRREGIKFEVTPTASPRDKKVGKWEPEENKVVFEDAVPVREG
jgi:hypothetical protein